MPKEKPTQTPVVEVDCSVSRQNIQAVNRFVTETDWSRFWSRVTESTAKEMDAYERARVKSLQTAAQHVFM